MLTVLSSARALRPSPTTTDYGAKDFKTERGDPYKVGFLGVY